MSNYHEQVSSFLTQPPWIGTLQCVLNVALFGVQSWR